MATTPQQPQRVPLVRDAAGNPLYITREWLGFLLAGSGSGSTSTGGPTQAQFDSLTARVATLESLVSALQTTVSALAASVGAIPEPFDIDTLLWDEQGRLLFDQDGYALLSQ